MNSDTSPSRCRLRCRAWALGASSALGQHVRERSDAQSLRSLLVQRVGTRKHGQKVDDVLLDLFLDVEMLMLGRFVKRITKEFAQRTDRYQRSYLASLACLEILSYCLITILSDYVYREVKGQSANPGRKTPIYSVFFVSAIDSVGCQSPHASSWC
jgi:hypothetical protein